MAGPAVSGDKDRPGAPTPETRAVAVVLEWQRHDARPVADLIADAIRAAVEAEREACARLCEGPILLVGRAVAERIRARGSAERGQR